MPVARGTVLIVDDDDAIRTAVTWALAYAGYDVLEAEHGQAALDQIVSNRPDLVLLDMRMSVMDGAEFVRQYRDLPGPHAPVVIMTAAHEAHDHSHQIQEQGYLAKPFGVDALLAVVSQYLPG
jgi:two-component system, chemotaxis family, chemotaxis protein CheY